jgi:hypothetical protein
MAEAAASKVPEVTLVFWIIKIAATTLGETGGDTVTMTLNWGYLAGTALFLSLLVVFVVWQIATKTFHPFLYWATIVASTTAGTTMADFADRSLGIGYAGGSLVLFVCLMAALGAWYRSQGSISVATVNTPGVEIFYWIAITFSQTLGRRRRPRLWRRRTRLRRRFGAGCGGIFLDRRVAGVFVLGGVHPHPAARRHRRRFSRQAGQRRWPGLEPADRLGRHRRLHRRMYSGITEARGPPSGTHRGAVIGALQSARSIRPRGRAGRGRATRSPRQCRLPRRRSASRSAPSFRSTRSRECRAP